MDFLSNYFAEIFTLLTNIITGYVAYKKGKKSGG